MLDPNEEFKGIGYKGQTTGPGGPPPPVDGLILKPQYDLNKFMPGTALHIRSGPGATDPFYNFDNNCLVTKATPLTISVVYVNNKVNRHIGSGFGDEVDYGGHKTIDIPIDLVAEGRVKIEFLGGKK